MQLSRNRALVVKARLGRIEVSKQAHNFSIAHFTIFSATEREDLHGHNYQVSCSVVAPIDADGLMFDYGILKDSIRDLCAELDEKMILPEKSPYLQITTEGDYVVAVFNDEKIPFLPRDVKAMPVANTTVEEFSHYFLERLLKHESLDQRDIEELTVTISSSPGQSGQASWHRS